MEEKKSEKRFSESSRNTNRAHTSENRHGVSKPLEISYGLSEFSSQARSRSSICEMLQLFSASLPVSQSSRRLTPSQEEIVASREQEDGEAEREYIRARQETGDIYVHSGIIDRPS